MPHPSTSYPPRTYTTAPPVPSPDTERLSAKLAALQADAEKVTAALDASTILDAIGGRDFSIAVSDSDVRVTLPDATNRIVTSAVLAAQLRDAVRHYLLARRTEEK